MQAFWRLVCVLDELWMNLVNYCIDRERPWQWRLLIYSHANHASRVLCEEKIAPPCRACVCVFLVVYGILFPLRRDCFRPCVMVRRMAFAIDMYLFTLAKYAAKTYSIS